MAKDPAFLFYPNDYIGGTMGMTFEEKGAYIELLMMQFNRGHMTSHMIGQAVGQLWVKLQDKFVEDKDGLWYNVRLEIEQNKRKAFTDSRSNNRKGINQYSKKIGHMTSHMENENRSLNIEVNTSNYSREEISNITIELNPEIATQQEKDNRFAAVQSELNNWGQWHEDICSATSREESEIKTLIDNFLIFVKPDDNYLKNIKEIKNHFKNWVNKQPKSNVNGKRNIYDHL